MEALPSLQKVVVKVTFYRCRGQYILKRFQNGEIRESFLEYCNWLNLMAVKNLKEFDKNDMEEEMRVTKDTQKDYKNWKGDVERSPEPEVEEAETVEDDETDGLPFS